MDLSSGSGRGSTDIRSIARAVSLFRPARRVEAPDGRSWELYVYRVRLPRWQSDDYSVPTEADSTGGIVTFVVELPLFVVTQVLVPLGRMLVRLPSAVARGLRSDVVTIEAVTFWPSREELAWTAQRRDAARVLEEIAAELAQGRIARPARAVFRGALR